MDSKTLTKVKENIKLLYKLNNYQNTGFEVKESFVMIKEPEFQYCYTTRDNLFLANIKSFSYFIKNKKEYKIIVISEDLFTKYKGAMEHYKSNKIY
ncbi:MAG: hypothetical protein U9Q66_02165 [Patescibacteria group bacterium]|nr:hypothetical protein [Patescibacteria group bacterium]